jgi:hypothetical protein
LSGDRAVLAPLADALVEDRLLTRGAGTIEIAHEMLLRRDPIRGWLEEDREFLIWRDRLARERKSYEANQRGLLTERELQIAIDWLKAGPTDQIARADLRFVAMSAARGGQTDNADKRRLRQLREQAEEIAALKEASTGKLVETSVEKPWGSRSLLSRLASFFRS